MPSGPPPDPPRYLVEWYRPNLTDELLAQTVHRIDRCAGELSAQGTVVDLLLTLFVPDDEVASGLFAAGSSASVAQLCRRAELPFDRIAEAVESAVPQRRALRDSEPSDHGGSDGHWETDARGDLS